MIYSTNFFYISVHVLAYFQGDLVDADVLGFVALVIGAFTLKVVVTWNEDGRVDGFLFGCLVLLLATQILVCYSRVMWWSLLSIPLYAVLA